MRDRRTWTLLALLWTASLGASVFFHTQYLAFWTAQPVLGWISHLLTWFVGILILAYVRSVDGKLEQTRHLVSNAREDMENGWTSESERALRESEARYRFLAENANDIVWMTRLDGTGVYHSPSVERVLGLTPDEANRRTTEKALTPASLETVAQIFADEAAKPESERRGEIVVEVELYRKDGSTVWVESSIRDMRDEQGNVVGFQGRSRDITDRRLAQESLRRKSEVLSALSRYSAELAAVPYWADIFETVARKIVEIFGVSSAAVSTYDAATHSLVVRRTSLDDEIRQSVVKALGRPIEGMHIPASDDLYRQLSAEAIADGKTLVEVTFGGIAEEIAGGIEHHLGVEWMVGVALRTEEDVIGTVLMGAPSSVPRPPNDELHAFGGITANALARWLTEQRSATNEERIASLFRAAPIGIGASVGRVITEVNDRLCDLAGREAADLIGRTESCLFVDDGEYARVMNEAETALRDGGIAHSETKFARRDGSVVPVSYRRTSISPQNPAQGLLFTAQDITRRLSNEAELREQKNYFEQMFLQSSISTQILDRDGWCERVNPQLSRIFGVKPEHIEGRVYNIFQDREVCNTGVVRHLERVFHRGETAEWEVHFDIGVAAESQNIEVEAKRQVWYHNWAFPVFDAEGKLAHVIIQHTDISDRKRAEADNTKLQTQLRQAMKMEAIGRLAGGVAHDFNNLLTAITGNVSLALGDLRPEDPLTEPLQEARQAAASAADLTRQLLAFSRKQIIEPRILNMNDLVSNLKKMLGRLLGEDIRLTTRLDENLDFVKVDPGQFEQVIVNLAVNARDAMPKGGALMIETTNVELDDEQVGIQPHVKPGRYVLLIVSDTGHGMNPEVKEHLFEPFFTTKPAGRGTGLGLATSYGVVTQAGGDIRVYSEVGRGTTFRIYLPRAEGSALDLPFDKSRDELPSGTETLLLVEDEEGVRKLAARVLSRLGYTVLDAPDGRKALEIVATSSAPIDLLVTDVVMPGMNGRELAEKVLAEYPDTKVLFTSGYTEDVVLLHGVVDRDFDFIAKPYTPQTLSTKVRMVLDRA